MSDDEDWQNAYDELADMKTEDWWQTISELTVQTEESADKFVPPKNIIPDCYQLFEKREQLGRGASCSVFLVASKLENGKLYALKELAKSDEYNEKLFISEIKIMSKLLHPAHKNLVQLVDCFIDDNNFYLLLEYVSGGTLLERIISRKHFSEQIAANWIKTILTAIQHMHSLNIVHRDFKTDNFMFSANHVIKVIDFGHSQHVADDALDQTLVGGRHFLPPESWRTRTGAELKKGDMWSVGICCYIILCGRYPFHGDTEEEIFYAIKNDKLLWPATIKLSDNCKDFIQKLLRKTTKQRLSADQALKHSWIVNKASNTHLGNAYMDELKNFQCNKLQTLLLNSMLEQMSAKERQHIFSIMKRLKMDKKGTVNTNDIIRYMLVNSDIKHNVVDKKEIEHEMELRLSSFITEHGHDPELEEKEDDTIKINKILDELDFDEIFDGMKTPDQSNMHTVSESGDVEFREIVAEDFDSEGAFLNVLEEEAPPTELECANTAAMNLFNESLKKPSVKIRTVQHILTQSGTQSDYIKMVTSKLKPTKSGSISIDSIEQYSTDRNENTNMGKILEDKSVTYS